MAGSRIVGLFSSNADFVKEQMNMHKEGIKICAAAMSIAGFASVVTGSISGSSALSISVSAGIAAASMPLATASLLGLTFYRHPELRTKSGYVSSEAIPAEMFSYYSAGLFLSANTMLSIAKSFLELDMSYAQHNLPLLVPFLFSFDRLGAQDDTRFECTGRRKIAGILVVFRDFLTEERSKMVLSWDGQSVKTK